MNLKEYTNVEKFFQRANRVADYQGFPIIGSCPECGHLTFRHIDEDLVFYDCFNCLKLSKGRYFSYYAQKVENVVTFIRVIRDPSSS